MDFFTERLHCRPWSKCLLSVVPGLLGFPVRKPWSNFNTRCSVGSRTIATLIELIFFKPWASFAFTHRYVVVHLSLEAYRKRALCSEPPKHRAQSMIRLCNVYFGRLFGKQEVRWKPMPWPMSLLCQMVWHSAALSNHIQVYNRYSGHRWRSTQLDGKSTTKVNRVDNCVGCGRVYCGMACCTDGIGYRYRRSRL